MVKKLVLSTLFALQASILFSQDTTWYDDGWSKVNKNENFSFYEVLYRNGVDTNQAGENVYYKSGKIKQEQSYSNYRLKKLSGKYKKWDENGQLREEIDYKDGKLNGWVLTYWANGNAKRKDSCNNDKVIKGECFKQNGGDTTYFDFEILPQFPGEKDALYEYLGKHINYPIYERKKGITGRLVIQFTVNTDGSISDAEIIKSATENFDNEAMRVVQSFPNWTPAIRDGEPVKMRFTLPIKFSLN